MKKILISVCVLLAFGASACKHSYASSARPGNSVGSDASPLPQNVRLTTVIDTTAKPARAYLTIRNGNLTSIYFPKEEPDFRVNEQARIVDCWFGYFENTPASQSRSDYSLPVMQEVMPGQEISIELMWPELVQLIAGGQSTCISHVRFSLVNFPFFRVRGDKRVAEYLEKSIVVDSSAVLTR